MSFAIFLSMYYSIVFFFSKRTERAFLEKRKDYQGFVKKEKNSASRVVELEVAC